MTDDDEPCDLDDEDENETTTAQMSANEMIRLSKLACELSILTRPTAERLMDCISMGDWHASVEALMMEIKDEIKGRMGL